MPASIRVHSTQ
ncbi:unnamed protein product, partial [Rotaria sp. Silwood2]